MTKDDWIKKRWGAGDQVTIGGRLFTVVAVDFSKFDLEVRCEEEKWREPKQFWIAAQECELLHD